MQTAFFLDDEFDGTISQPSLYPTIPPTHGNKPENVSDPRPRIGWVAGWPQHASGMSARFEVDDSNYLIRVRDSGSLEDDIQVTKGAYTADTLVTALDAAFAASSRPAAQDWTWSWNPATGLFSAGGTAALEFRWTQDTSHNLAKELGWVNPGGTYADTTPAVSQQSLHPRYNTHTFIQFKMSEGKNLRAWMCEVANAERGEIDETIDVSNIKIYGNDYAFTNLNGWAGGATVNVSFSGTPDFSENQIRLAYYNSGAASTQRNWLFSWRHQDSHLLHTVKLCKAFERTWSDTGRTLTTLKKQGMLNTGQSLGIDNYYPVPRLQRWVAPLAFDAWPASEYRDVVQGVVHHGRQNGLMWALRWDDIVSGAVDAKDEADKGYLLWATLQDYSLDSYVGESADYISGEIGLEQLR